MPAGATVLITLGGALIGAVAALGGAWLQMQNARQERRRTELREQREEGAAVVGPLFTFLDDSRPETILSEFELGNASYVEEVQQRWRSVKDALYVYAIANPNFGITVLADEFASSLGLSIELTSQAVNARLRGLSSEDDPEYKRLCDLAEYEYEEARFAVRRLAEALRDQEAGWLRELGQATEREEQEELAKLKEHRRIEQQRRIEPPRVQTATLANGQEGAEIEGNTEAGSGREATEL